MWCFRYRLRHSTYADGEASCLCKQRIYTNRVWLCTNRKGGFQHGEIPPMVIPPMAYMVAEWWCSVFTIVQKPLRSAPKRNDVAHKEIWHTIDARKRHVISRHTDNIFPKPVEPELETVNLVQHLPISAGRLHNIRSATEKDKTLQLLIKTMSKSWPEDKSQVLSETRPLFSLPGDLSQQDWIIFRGEC